MNAPPNPAFEDLRQIFGTKRSLFALAALLLATVLAALADPAARADAAEACPENAQFRTGVSASLPDCRAFELVSPPDGLGYAAQGQAAQPDGNGLYWWAAGGIQIADPAPPDGARTDWFLAKRAAGGWAQSWITPDPPGTLATHMEAFNALPGMRADGVTFDAQAPGEAFFSYTALFRGGAAGSALVSAPAGAEAVEGLDETQWLVSEDLDTTVFSTEAALDPADTNGRADLYVRRGDTLTWLSRHTDGSADSSASAPYLPLVGGNATAAARYDTFGVSGFPRSEGADPVAPDGAAIVFATAAALDPADTDGADDLYLWRDGEGVSLISDDERDDPGCPTVGGSTTDCPAPVGFAGMAPDASVLYLRTSEGLVDADTDGAADLYEYRPSAPAGERLTLASGGGAAPAYPVTVTPDGTLFFISADRLGGAPPPAGSTPVLYRWRQGTITTVAVLDDRDVIGGESLVGIPTERPARASVDGETIVFRTRATLDPVGDTDDAPDIYRWRAGQGVELVSGHDPEPVTLGAGHEAQGLIGPIASAIPVGAGRAISADGSRVFFTTPAPLTGDAGDNGRSKLYEWQEGEGISLLSPAGDGAGPVGYLDSSESGDDVFFLTGQALATGDTDGTVPDVYDARVGGGLPEPPPPAIPCGGDACQGPAAGPPTPSAISSTGLAGEGNVPRPPALALSVKVSGPEPVAGPVARLAVRVSDAGRITATGSRVRQTGRSVKKAGSYPVKVALSSSGKKALGHRKRLKVDVQVSYRAKDGRSVSRTAKVTFKAPQAKTGKGGH